ncbi:MAG: hypothetical protein LBR48_05535 [Dysgonamonadaceae bacterium]|jgi:hypothetical protein|nr:hypothetical protein [Dysgonamonadaceae bacterium]
MKYLIFPVVAILLWGCSNRVPEGRQTDRIPLVYPDYNDVTIPPNIAPLRFAMTNPLEEAYAVFSTGSFSETVKASKGEFKISESAWKNILKKAVGQCITVTITAKAKDGEAEKYLPLKINVSKEPIDPYIAYRLIEPGYELWNEMGIYQRNLENFEQRPILENRLTDKNCMNCHSFCMQNPDLALFHVRAKHAGTILVNGKKIEKLNTKTPETISNLVYPSWHPSGKFVAFSVNSTKQSFHTNDPNRIEVFDEASDVVVYDVEKHEIVTDSLIFSTSVFETFPTFSPDGKTLYFCSAEAQPMPQSFRDVRYSLCSIAFDAENRCFGDRIDTLYRADAENKSVSFPRVSPNGKFLVFTLSAYGNFSIWHKDADLYIVDLQTKTTQPLDVLNSDDVESYHSWSSNSHWLVFSSRRLDGLYTRPFFAYIDDRGKASKPFLLPQKNTEYYTSLMKSFNIPEFITGKVGARTSDLAAKIKNDKGIDLTFAK